MVPTRKGDGTGLGAKGYSQVRKGDGTVLWNAIPASVVDNFEAADGDPPGPYESGETIADYYRGATGSYGRTTTNAVEGSFAMEATVESSNDYIYSLPGDGLPNYPDAGQTVDGIINDPDAIDPGVLAGASENANGIDGYLYRILVGADEIRIDRLTDYQTDGSGTLTNLQIGATSLSASTNYWFEVRPPTSGDATVSFGLYNVDNSGTEPSKGAEITTISTTDSDHTDDRGIGVFRASSSGVGTIADRLGRVL